MIQISRFSDTNERFVNLLKRQGGIPAEVMSTTAEILDNVRINGDKALNMYMKRFDNIDLEKESILVSDEEFERAKKQIDASSSEAIKRACDNIMTYHEKQKIGGYKVEYEDGVVLERKYKPLQRAAVTVPGDMAPLVSSMYMNLIPAIVAGVPEICIITKPKLGSINPILLFTADYLGVKNIYKISGAQGIAAVAYGTERVKKVDIIAGPGNNYTQAAKKLLYGNVRIDSLAGPSEIAIIADDSVDPKYIAADVLSQAEHGTGFEASTVFCTNMKQVRILKCKLKRLSGMVALTLK
jgi:histidinol dehydrogenase